MADLMCPKWVVRKRDGRWTVCAPAGRTWSGFPSQRRAVDFAVTLVNVQPPLTAAHRQHERGA